ncbi:hypothetical protein [Paraburkholderia oxyphila]|uniref:hypothetical protein n=1 Tax=Paraburkholderia oxyphila TaxID=614212 RepID=UPI000693C883|nr:hypothetical protein [Paraburkholderia oxyphila]
MPYTKVQLIAHCLNTGPKPVGGGKEYPGLPDAQADIARRVELIKAAMTAALPRANPNDDVLKVMMWPEFLLRGKTGAYEMDDVQRVVQALQTAVKDTKWQDWLFVFGTIVGFSRGEQPGLLAWLFGARQPLEGYNYALIQKGGADAGPDTAFAVLKEYKSGIDFIESAQLAGNDGITLDRIEHLDPVAPGPRDESQRVSYDGCGVFNIVKDAKAVKIGVEICLDYIAGRLAGATPRPQVDLHLIPSCGAEIEKWDRANRKYLGTSRLVARKDACAFNCDGLHDYRAARLGNPDPGYASDVRVVEDPTRTPQQTRRIDPDPEVAVVLPGADELYVGGAGKVRVYPAQPL